MRPTKFTIAAGEIERMDDVDDGTTRPIWRAWVNLEFRDGGLLKTAGGQGEGKAAHVALNRACTAALATAGR